MKRSKKIIISLLLIMLLTGCKSIFTYENNQSKKVYLTGKHYALMEIKDYGKVKLELDADSAPITVTNFMELVNEGFYDGLTIHRVKKDFVIQGGDPTGTGSGGSGENIKGEFLANGVENNISHTRGAISMARNSSSYDSASSQFFIVQKDSSDILDNYYAAFGYVVEGMDVVDKICEKVTVVDSNGMILDDDLMPIITSIKEIEM